MHEELQKYSRHKHAWPKLPVSSYYLHSERFYILFVGDGCYGKRSTAFVVTDIPLFKIIATNFLGFIEFYSIATSACLIVTNMLYIHVA